MKYKKTYTNKHGFEFYYYVNQQDEVVWKEQEDCFHSQITDRQYQYLIQLTSFKGMDVSRGIMEGLEKLNGLIQIAVCDSFALRPWENFKQVETLIEAMEKIDNEFDINKLSKIGKVDFQALKERLLPYRQKNERGRPEKIVTNRLRDLVVERTSEFIHKHNLLVKRRQYNESGLFDFYDVSFKFLDIDGELMYTDEKRFKQFIANSLDKTNPNGAINPD